MGSDHVDRPAELAAYAVLLFTLAILPLAFALHDPGKNPLFVGLASIVSSFMWVGLMTFSIRTIGSTSRRDT